MKPIETSYDPRTPPEVVRILENCRVWPHARRIRIRYGHTKGPKAGLDWLEEHDVEGTVGRSMGPIKVPLMIHNARSTGGQAIMDECIVRIIDAKTHKVLYSHPKYHHPEFTAVSTRLTSLRLFKFRAAVLADGELHAQFKDKRAAIRWVRKMSL
jgi:hypothetical protein